MNGFELSPSFLLWLVVLGLGLEAVALFAAAYFLALTRDTSRTILAILARAQEYRPRGPAGEPVGAGDGDRIDLTPLRPAPGDESLKRLRRMGIDDLVDRLALGLSRGNPEEEKPRPRGATANLVGRMCPDCEHDPGRRVVPILSPRGRCPNCGVRWVVSYATDSGLEMVKEPPPKSARELLGLVCPVCDGEPPLTGAGLECCNCGRAFRVPKGAPPDGVILEEVCPECRRGAADELDGECSRCNAEPPDLEFDDPADVFMYAAGRGCAICGPKSVSEAEVPKLDDAGICPECGARFAVLDGRMFEVARGSEMERELEEGCRFEWSPDIVGGEPRRIDLADLAARAGLNAADRDKTVLTCRECGHVFATADSWVCLQCGAGAEGGENEVHRHPGGGEE